MKSVKRGRAASRVEVVHVSARGFWIFFEPLDREMYLPFEKFPWFADATILELADIELERGHILRWPALDVDLDTARIEAPDRYPLIGASTRRRRRARPRGNVRITR